AKRGHGEGASSRGSRRHCRCPRQLVGGAEHGRTGENRRPGKPFLPCRRAGYTDLCRGWQDLSPRHGPICPLERGRSDHQPGEIAMTRWGMVLLLVLIAVPVQAGSGVKGRAAWRGELVPEVRVRAYRAIADIAAGQEVAVAAPS